MKTVIRQSVFETNSSSTHSITISNKGSKQSLPFEGNICIIHQDEFGWGSGQTHSDPATKASYCYTYARYNKDEMLMLRDVLEKEMGMTVKFSDEIEGYIDHQSDRGEGDACGEAFVSKKKLRDFIFNSESFLTLDSDNG